MKVRPRIGLASIALGWLVAFLPAATHAATNLIVETPTFARSFDWTALFIRLVGAMFLVIALLLGGALYFKKSRFFAQYGGAAARLRILESRSLGFRSNLLVVGYDQHRYLLSVSPTAVQMLTALPQAGQNESSQPSGPSFAERLKSAEEKTT